MGYIVFQKAKDTYVCRRPVSEGECGWSMHMPVHDPLSQMIAQEHAHYHDAGGE